MDTAHFFERIVFSDKNITAFLEMEHIKNASKKGRMNFNKNLKIIRISSIITV